MFKKNRKPLIIIGGIVILAIVAYVMYVGANSSRTTIEPSTITLEDLKPDTSTQFLNESDLTDQGVSSLQIKAMEQAFNQFNKSAKRVIIFGNSVKTEPHDPSSSLFIINFTASVDDVSYKAKMEYFDDLRTMRLYLTDPSGRQVFDSKNIKADA